MPRLLSRSLAFGLLALASLSPALAALDAVRYLMPVSYNMVITRPGVSTETTKKGVTTETTPYSFEVFANKDILKLILGVPTDAEIKGWSLYALGNSETFTDPDGLESLQLVARKKNDTEALRTLPEDMSFSLSLSVTRAYSSSAIHDDSADGEVLSKREGIAQLVTLTQTLPARGTRAAGTLVTTGYISHGLVYDKVTVGEEKTATAVNVPTAASFRATGTYDANSDSDSEDGLAEVLITLGSPVLQAAEADAN
jgi:hypothetical protein